MSDSEMGLPSVRFLTVGYTPPPRQCAKTDTLKLPATALLSVYAFCVDTGYPLIAIPVVGLYKTTEVVV